MLQQGGAASSSLGVVDDAAAIELAKELALNDTTATELDLSGQEVGNAGATALAAALETNTTLTLLDLAINKVGAAGAAAFLSVLQKKQNTTLQYLDLSGNGDDVDADVLCEIANALERNQMGDEMSIEVQMRAVESAEPTPQATLRGPNLLACGVEDVEMKALDAAGVQRVAAELLAASRGRIRSPVPEHSSDVDGRRHDPEIMVCSLRLTSCTIDVSAAKLLGAALKAGAVTTLALTSMECVGSSFAVLAAALEKNAPLTALHLRSPKQPAVALDVFEPFTRILSSNEHLRELVFDRCNVGSDELHMLVGGLSRRGVLPSLTSLSLLHNPAIGADGTRTLLTALAELPQLRALDVSVASIGNEGAEAMVALLTSGPALSALTLRSNGIENDGVRAIGAALLANSTLTKLDLVRNESGASGAAALAEAIRSCRLRVLDLRENAVGDAGASSLAASLEARECCLTWLGLDQCGLGVAGATSLATALLKNRTLQTLLIRWNGKVGTAGTASLAAALLKNYTLQRLDLGSCKVGAVGAASIAAALEKGVSTLTSLDLGWNAIGDDGAASLAAALRVSTSLEALYLHDTGIQWPGLAAIAAAMEHNQTLTMLDLGSTESTKEMIDENAVVLDAYEGIKRRLQRNKLLPKPPTTPPQGWNELKRPTHAELSPAVHGSRASQAAHRRLMSTGAGRSPPDPGVATVR